MVAVCDMTLLMVHHFCSQKYGMNYDRSEYVLASEFELLPFILEGISLAILFSFTCSSFVSPAVAMSTLSMFEDVSCEEVVSHFPHRMSSVHVRS